MLFKKNKKLISILNTEMKRYRQLSYGQLIKKIGAVETHSFGSKKDKNFYQLEIMFIFDDPETRKNIRVIGNIDDGRWRAFMPISRSFIKAPDNTFIGE